jgi:HNH endonuclease
MPRTTIPVIDRILAKVVVDDATECWVFIGGHDNHGYGRVWHLGAMRLPHRVTYEYYVAPIPFGLSLDHLCRVRACCNPTHLEPVTHHENVLRGNSVKSRTHCPQGHEFTAENTRITRQGSRSCRVCGYWKVRAYKDANRDAINSRRRARRAQLKETK